MKPYLYGCLYHVFVPRWVAGLLDVKGMVSFPVPGGIVLLMKLELKNKKTIFLMMTTQLHYQQSVAKICHVNTRKCLIANSACLPVNNESCLVVFVAGCLP